MVWMPWNLMEKTWTLLLVSFQSRQLSGTEQSSHTYDSKEIPFHIFKDRQSLGNWLIYVLLNVRCTALIQKKTVSLLSISIYVGSVVTETVDITSQKCAWWHFSPHYFCHMFHKSSNYPRPGLDGWTQLCCMCQCALYHSWHRTHQHTILLSWFSCASRMYYHWFRTESASPLPLIQSTYSLLWWNSLWC